MAAPRLFHFSEEPGIAVFEPRPVAVQAARPPGRESLNGPLVWAIEADWRSLYLFPRDCPRILLRPMPGTTPQDRTRWLGEAETVAFIEAAWLERLRASTIFRYDLAHDGFEDLGDAGMWVSRQAVAPERVEALDDLPAALAEAGVELRVVERLTPLRGVWDTSLHASGIRLRNAQEW